MTESTLHDLTSSYSQQYFQSALNALDYQQALSVTIEQALAKQLSAFRVKEEDVKAILERGQK